MPRVTGRTLAAVLALVIAGVGVVAAVRGINADRNPRAEAGVVPAVGTTGASTCTDPTAGNRWRVTWRIAAAPPAGTTSSLAARAGATVIVPTGFALHPGPAQSDGAASELTPSPPETASATLAAGLAAPPLPGGWVPKDADVWLLRWSPTPAETLAAAPDETYERAGPFATLVDVPVDVGQSPRYVTPDGSCTVFVSPFANGTLGEKTVAVAGDSLVAQLYASPDGSPGSPGALAADLAALGYRSEISGQSGRRFVTEPDKRPGIETADGTLVDEIRGLASADVTVVALGTNDAGWIALAPDQATSETRLSWTLAHLATLLDEIEARGRCAVLVTMATRDKTYVSTAPGRFDAVARRINAFYAERAGRSPSDALRLYDWATAADQHVYGSADPWFGTDTIHLVPEGQLAYADALARAATLC